LTSKTRKTENQSAAHQVHFSRVIPRWYYYRGLLQSDGYEAYAAYVRTREGVEWLGCWAHACRRFFEAAAERPKTAERVLRFIGRLYELEAEWDRVKIDADRAALRRMHFTGPLARLLRLTKALQARVPPKSGLGQACTYLLGHWRPLIAHLNHGQTRLDNNSVENAIRRSKLGARNWLFIGHPDAGDRMARDLLVGRLPPASRS
jgi:transposase